jgi:peptidoglycan hydrolase-like protein with peptidoglycan-binding domain
MYTKFASTILGLTLLLTPASASADQVSDLLAQIAALQQQILAAQGGSQAAATPTATLSQSGAYCPNLQRTLQFGMKGSDVGELQQFLIVQGLLEEDSVTAYFGVKTERAVQTFQVTQRIVMGGLREVTGFGVVGRKTRAVIQDVCLGGARPPVSTPLPTISLPTVPQTPTQPKQPYETVVESLLVTPKTGSAPLYASITAKLSCDPARVYKLVYGDGAEKQIPPPGGNCLSPREFYINHPYSPAGTYTLTLVANDAPVARTNIIVDVVKPSCSINSSVATVGAGQDFTLNWNSSNTTKAALSPISNDAPLSGATTTKGLSEGLSIFTLTVTGPGGTASCTTSVTITSPLATRDAQRITDLQTIANALRTYRSSNGSFPDTNGWINDCSVQGGGWIPGLSNMPRDPVDTCVWPYATTTNSSTATYAYWSWDGSDFALAARLENSAHPNTIRNSQALWFDGLSLENTYGWNKNTMVVLGTPVGTTSSLTAAQRDTQRVNDLQSILSALKSYYSAKGRYPVTGNDWRADCEVTGSSWIPDNQLPAGERFNWHTPYIGTLPRDPIDICEDAFAISSSSAASYGYWSDNGTRFALVARLEINSNPNTLSNRSAQLWFDGLSLLDHYKWNANTYVILASGAITKADSTAQLASVLSAAQGVLERMLEMLRQ